MILLSMLLVAATVSAYLPRESVDDSEVFLVEESEFIRHKDLKYWSGHFVISLHIGWDAIRRGWVYKQRYLAPGINFSPRELKGDGVVRDPFLDSVEYKELDGEFKDGCLDFLMERVTDKSQAVEIGTAPQKLLIRMTPRNIDPFYLDKTKWENSLFMKSMMSSFSERNLDRLMEDLLTYSSLALFGGKYTFRTSIIHGQIRSKFKIELVSEGKVVESGVYDVVDNESVDFVHETVKLFSTMCKRNLAISKYFDSPELYASSPLMILQIAACKFLMEVEQVKSIFERIRARISNDDVFFKNFFMSATGTGGSGKREKARLHEMFPEEKNTLWGEFLLNEISKYEHKSLKLRTQASIHIAFLKALELAKEKSGGCANFYSIVKNNIDYHLMTVEQGIRSGVITKVNDPMFIEGGFSNHFSAVVDLIAEEQLVKAQWTADALIKFEDIPSSRELHELKLYDLEPAFFVAFRDGCLKLAKMMAMGLVFHGRVRDPTMLAKGVSSVLTAKNKVATTKQLTEVLRFFIDMICLRVADDLSARDASNLGALALSLIIVSYERSLPLTSYGKECLLSAVWKGVTEARRSELEMCSALMLFREIDVSVTEPDLGTAAISVFPDVVMKLEEERVKKKNKVILRDHFKGTVLEHISGDFGVVGYPEGEDAPKSDFSLLSWYYDGVWAWKNPDPLLCSSEQDVYRWVRRILEASIHAFNFDCFISYRVDERARDERWYSLYKLPDMIESFGGVEIRHLCQLLNLIADMMPPPSVRMMYPGTSAWVILLVNLAKFDAFGKQSPSRLDYPDPAAIAERDKMPKLKDVCSIS